MLAVKTLIAAAALTLSLPSLAGTTLLDFESVSEVTTDLTVSNPYQPGINFTANAVSAASNKANINPGDGNFYRGLDGDGYTYNRGALVLWDGKTGSGSDTFSFFINVAGGFDTSFGLSYATGLTSIGRVEIFSEVNGSGVEVAQLGLTNTEGCDDDPAYICNWNDATIDLQGKVGRSIKVTGSNALLILDDLKFQLHDGGTQVPEPGGLALSLAALGALAWRRSKQRAA